MVKNWDIRRSLEHVVTGLLDASTSNDTANRLENFDLGLNWEFVDEKYGNGSNKKATKSSKSMYFRNEIDDGDNTQYLQRDIKICFDDGPPPTFAQLNQ